MKIMDFSYCEFLRKIPNVSSIPNLEELNLKCCKNLVKVHRSVGFFDKLVHLNLESCSNLTSFPRKLKLRSLKYLNLFGSSRLKKFPEMEGQMECLEYINLQYSGIEELPSSIGYLAGVKQIILNGCTNLTNLLDSIHKLQHLNELSLGCCTGIKELPSSIGFLGTIKTLNLHFCINLMSFPNSIYQLQNLEILNLNECKQLREIFGLPPNIIEVQARECMSLAIFLEEPTRSQSLN
jgi:Leucine-rich repeat (LRR) protein